MKIITKWEHIKQLEGVISDVLREESKITTRGLPWKWVEKLIAALGGPIES